LVPATTTGIRFVPLVLFGTTGAFATADVFETAKLAAVFDFDDIEEAFTEDFTGVTTAAPLDLAGAGLPLATAGADWRIPRA
jgi:hypothetical protein